MIGYRVHLHRGACVIFHYIPYPAVTVIGKDFIHVFAVIGFGVFFIFTVI